MVRHWQKKSVESLTGLAVEKAERGLSKKAADTDGDPIWAESVGAGGTGLRT